MCIPLCPHPAQLLVRGQLLRETEEGSDIIMSASLRLTLVESLSASPLDHVLGMRKNTFRKYARCRVAEYNTFDESVIIFCKINQSFVRIYCRYQRSKIWQINIELVFFTNKEKQINKLIFYSKICSILIFVLCKHVMIFKKW